MWILLQHFKQLIPEVWNQLLLLFVFILFLFSIIEIIKSVLNKAAQPFGINDIIRFWESEANQISVASGKVERTEIAL